MALSDEEQRLLDQMEAALAAEDPKLANAMRGTTTYRLHRRRAAIAGIAFLVGVGCLVGGMEVHPALSILGFLIMLAGTVVAVTSWQHVGPPERPAGPRHPSAEQAFIDRLEGWRRRQDDKG